MGNWKINLPCNSQGHWLAAYRLLSLRFLRCPSLYPSLIFSWRLLIRPPLLPKWCLRDFVLLSFMLQLTTLILAFLRYPVLPLRWSHCSNLCVLLTTLQVFQIVIFLTSPRLTRSILQMGKATRSTLTPTSAFVWRLFGICLGV